MFQLLTTPSHLKWKTLRMAVILATLLMLLASGCAPQHPVVPLDPRGQSLSEKTGTQAIVRTAKTVSLSRYRALAVITPPDCRITADEVGQLKAIGYFDEVVGLLELPKFATERHLLESPVRFEKWADYQALARAYKPFLLVRFRCIRKGDIWYRLTVTDPEKPEDLFVSEVRVRTEAGYFMQGLLTLGGGLTVDDDCVGADKDVRHPLYNSLIEWINTNR